MTAQQLDDLRKTLVPILDGMHGWCTPEKASAMYELIERERPVLVVEIGVFGGKSLVPQALALKANQRGIIYGIDPWTAEACLEGTNDPANDEWWKNAVNYDEMYLKCQHELAKHGLGRHAALMRCKSQDAACRFNNIDVLHIDGNHSEEVSCRDVEMWLPRMKQGGYVWVDDCDWSTTQRAQALVLEKADHYGQTGSCKLFKVR